jgi:hypothetical protein
MLPFSPQGRHIALALPHLPTLALAIGLSSCVPIPIDFEDEKLFQAEQVDFIEIGKSSKADISAAIFHLAEEMGETGVNKDLTCFCLFIPIFHTLAATRNIGFF